MENEKQGRPRPAFARELDALKRRPRLDETQPGGRYIGRDGRMHNAEGILIETPEANALSIEAAKAKLANPEGGSELPGAVYFPQYAPPRSIG